MIRISYLVNRISYVENRASGIQHPVSSIYQFLLLAGEAEVVGDLGRADLMRFLGVFYCSCQFVVTKRT
jgi:hypothetical protein